MSDWKFEGWIDSTAVKTVYSEVKIEGAKIFYEWFEWMSTAEEEEEEKKDT
jgi:hypothetical protein